MELHIGRQFDDIHGNTLRVELLVRPAKVKLTNISKFGQKYADFVKCAKPLFDFTGEFLPGTICSRADFTVSKSPSRTVKG